MADPTYNLNGGFKPTMKRFADLEGPDFFPRLAGPPLPCIESEKFSGDIWECACGDGTMSRVLEETGCTVPSTDLYQRGYGEAGHDFLKPSRSADNIVTNPPYNCAEGFVASGVKLARQSSRCCCALPFLKGQTAPIRFSLECAAFRVWVFSERITFYPNGVEPKGTGTTAYAWFVWDKDAPRTTELKWFKPGYRARFSS